MLSSLTEAASASTTARDARHWASQLCGRPRGEDTKIGWHIRSFHSSLISVILTQSSYPQGSQTLYTTDSFGLLWDQRCASLQFSTRLAPDCSTASGRGLGGIPASWVKLAQPLHQPRVCEIPTLWLLVSPRTQKGGRLLPPRLANYSPLFPLHALRGRSWQPWTRSFAQRTLDRRALGFCPVAFFVP